MAITIIRPDERRLGPVAPEVSNAPAAVLAASENQVLSMDNPFVQIARLGANAAVPLHSHSTYEVTIVLEGRVLINDVACGPGSVVITGAEDVYTETAGDEPATIVVVRPTKADFIVR